MRPYVHAVAERVILIYLPESLSDSFRKPVTSPYLRVSEPFPLPCDLFTRKSNKSESVVVSFMVEMLKNEKWTNAGLGQLRSFSHILIACKMLP